ncbi:unnamed protein product, partial [Cyprideis torosa]
MTATTPTGSAQVSRLFGDRVDHVYFPYDLPHVVRRFMRTVQPRILVLMETELWPNCLKYCHLYGVPVVVANARLSQSSLDGYLKVKPLLAPLLKTARVVAAQSDEDRQRFVSLGAAPDTVIVTGNVKSDVQVADEDRAQGAALRGLIGKGRPVWIAASTHDGEEPLVLAAFKQIQRQ